MTTRIGLTGYCAAAVCHSSAEATKVTNRSTPAEPPVRLLIEPMRPRSCSCRRLSPRTAKLEDSGFLETVQVFAFIVNRMSDLFPGFSARTIPVGDAGEDV